MKTRPVLIGAALLALFSAPLMAAPYGAIYAFGDSLSDAGNAYIATGGTTPRAPPYALVNGYGVFSNGPVWVQNLAGELGLGALLPSLAGGTDFAVGGARTGAFGAYPGSPGDLLPAPGNPLADSQLGMFSAAVPHPAANALYTLSIGANDLFTIFTTDAGNPTQAAADAKAVLGNIATFIGLLAADGARFFDVLNVPDLGLTPRARALGPTLAAEISAFTAAFDAALQAALASLAERDGLDLHLVDAFALVDQAVADPALFGLTNVKDPCLPPGSLTPCANPDQYLFWDDDHPTETGHRVLAAAALPEPSALALLAAGLALLALVAPRRLGLMGGADRQHSDGVRMPSPDYLVIGSTRLARRDAQERDPDWRQLQPS
jgi:phospholipase/lecithinase/hemolysin